MNPVFVNFSGTLVYQVFAKDKDSAIAEMYESLNKGILQNGTINRTCVQSVCLKEFAIDPKTTDGMEGWRSP